MIVRNIQVRMLLAIAIQSWELVGLVPWDPDIVLRSRVKVLVLETSEDSESRVGIAIHWHPAYWRA